MSIFSVRLERFGSSLSYRCHQMFVSASPMGGRWTGTFPLQSPLPQPLAAAGRARQAQPAPSSRGTVPQQPDSPQQTRTQPIRWTLVHRPPEATTCPGESSLRPVRSIRRFGMTPKYGLRWLGATSPRCSPRSSTTTPTARRPGSPNSSITIAPTFPTGSMATGRRASAISKSSPASRMDYSCPMLHAFCSGSHPPGPAPAHSLRTPLRPPVSVTERPSMSRSAAAAGGIPTPTP